MRQYLTKHALLRNHAIKQLLCIFNKDLCISLMPEILFSVHLNKLYLIAQSLIKPYSLLEHYNSFVYTQLRNHEESYKTQLMHYCAITFLSNYLSAFET